MKVVAVKKGEVILRLIDLDTLDPKKSADQYWNLLDTAEREKYLSLKLESKKQEYFITRVLIRKSLSEHTNVRPEEWHFSTGPFGRPQISHPIEEISLTFNVSHTEGILVCAIAVDCSLGVDIEVVRPVENLLGVAESTFNPKELQRLMQLDEDLRVQRFYEYWTLKEAYVKAREKGLSLPTKDFSFEFGSDETISVFTECSHPEDSQDWRFLLRRPTAQHQLAVAYKEPGGGNLIISEKWETL